VSSNVDSRDSVHLAEYKNLVSWRAILIPPCDCEVQETVALVKLGFTAAGLGGDDGWCYYHSDESQSNQNIMHGVPLLCGVLMNFSTPSSSV